MAETTLDDMRIEIDASAENAKESIDTLIQNLEVLQEATGKIDSKKLESIQDILRGFTAAGDGLKMAGDGIRSVSSAIRNMESVDSSKLKDISEAIGKIGAGLGNLGSNNKINIRVDADAIRESVQPLEQMKDSLANTTLNQSVERAAEDIRNAVDSAAQSTDKLATCENNLNTAGRSASAGIQELIKRIKEYKSIISGMESGKREFDMSAYTEALNGLEQAQNQFNEFRDSVRNTPSTMKDISYAISSIGKEVQQSGLHSFASMLNGIAGMLPIIGTSGMEASAGFQAMAVGLQAVQAAIPIIGIVLTAITALANAVKKASNAINNALDKAVSAVKSFARKTKQAVLAVGEKFEALGNKIKESFGIQDHSMKNFAKKFKSLARLGTFMLLRKAFTYLFKFIGEGFNNLVLYSDKFGTEFSKNVSILYSDLKWLGNAFSTAFEPILNYITPMLDFLFSKLVSVCNVLAQLFALLTGKSTWTRAKRLSEDYRKSIDKTKKSIMGLADGIDELHNLHENTDSDSGATDPGDMFETLPIDDKFKNLFDWLKDMWDKADFSDLGRLLGEKLRKALESIPWDKIKKTLRKIAKSIATFLNGFLETPGLFRVIGKTVAQAINSAFEFLDEFAWNFHWDSLGQAIIDAVQGAIDTLDWDVISHAVTGVAKGIADFFNTIFDAKKTWGDLGNTIAKAINTIIHGLYIFVHNFDFADFGSAIATGLGNALSNIAYWKLGDVLATGINGAFEALYNFAVTFPWSRLADSITYGINNALSKIDWETIRQGFSTACSEFGSFINRLLVGENGEGGINWTKIGQDLIAACVTVIEGIGNFFAELDPEEIGTKIGEFVNGAFSYLRDNKDVVITAVNNVISTLSGIFDSAINEIDFETIFSTIGEIVANIHWAELFGTAFEAIAKAWSFENIFKIDVLSGIGASIVHSITDGLLGSITEKFAECGLEIVNGLKKGIEDNVPSLQGLMSGGFAGKIMEWFKSKLSINSPSKQFESFGQFTVQGYQNGINAMMSSLSSVINGLGTKILNWFNSKLNLSTLVSAGSNVIKGFINGLNSAYSSLKSVVSNLANSVSSIFKGILKIHSPSKLFYSFGEYTVQGFNNAIDSMAGSTQDSVENWAKSFSDMKANLGFTVDYSGIEKNQLDDYSDFVATATGKIQSNIDISSNQGDVFDYDTMGNVYKEALRDIMTQIVVPAIERSKGQNDRYGSSDRMGLLKEIQEQAAIYSKSTGLAPFPV